MATTPAAQSTAASARVVAARMAQQGADVERAALDELERVAQGAARAMRRLAPTWRSASALVQSIRVDRPSASEREIRPGVRYAEAVERGVRPGGKGLPRFFDPASADVVAWLRTRAFAGARTPRRGSRALQAMNLSLRDRYEGLAWHIRHKGTRAHPFVAPVAAQMEQEFPARIALACRRALVARGADGGGVAA